MSAPGPSSIPTSADPRSRRPTKKRALSPASAQAASLNALFAKPDQRIAIPSGETKRPRHLPPEIVTNVQGSSAGAGSGEFHVYKASRRREYERLREMDEALAKEKEQEQFEKDRVENQKRDEERTRKNREKREKMKARKGKNANRNHQSGNDQTQAAETTNCGKEPHSSREDKVENGGETLPGAAHAVGLVIHDDD